MGHRSDRLYHVRQRRALVDASDASGGWNESASAWIEAVRADGDYGRRFVLDVPMCARIEGRGFADALDVGCGEGRFCRIMQTFGIRTVGIDPTIALIERARELDPHGEYRIESAETSNAPPESFDLVVSYLSLIDIAELERAIRRMVAALRPGGTLLIANLTSFNTAGMPDGWTADGDGPERFSIDRYLDERRISVEWNGIRVQNWHRPLSRYVTSLLESGLELRYFAEPAPVGGDVAKAERYRRVPFFLIMEWSKPAR